MTAELETVASAASAGEEVLPSADISREDLKEATFKSLRWATTARVAAEISSVVAAIILAHLVPPTEFGRVAVAAIVSELALALANEGVGSALVRRSVLERAHVESAALLSLFVGTVLMLTTLFLVPLATTPLFGAETTSLFRLFSPMFIIAALGIVPLAMLERRLDFKRISMIEIATVLSGSAASVILALAGLDAEAYVLGTMFGMATWAALLVIFGPSAFPRWRPRQLKEVARFGLPAGLAGTAAVGYGNVDYSVLGATLSPAQVGFYYRAYALGVLYQNKISAIINRLVYPIYSRTEDMGHMRELRSRVMRVNVVVIFPALSFFIAVAPLLVPLVFGAEWEPAVLPAQILTVAGMARMINNGTPPLVLAAGKPRALLMFNLYRVSFLGVAVYLASSHGLVAVCIAVSAFQVITLVGSYAFMLNRLVGVTLRQLARDVTPALVSSAIMLAAAFMVQEALTAEDAPRLVIIAAVGVISAPFYLVVLRFVSRDAWNDLFLILRKVLIPARLHKAVAVAPAPAPDPAASSTAAWDFPPDALR